MWRVIDVFVSRAEDLDVYIQGIHGARAALDSHDGMAISGRQLHLGEISFEWSTLTGDLSLLFDPRETDRTTFLFLSDGAIHLDLGDAGPKPLTTAAFPTERLEKVTLRSGSTYVIVSIPKAKLRNRLSSLLGGPSERILNFVNFPEPDGGNLKVLRDQIFLLPSTPLVLSADLLGSRNQSLVNLIVDSFLLLYPNSYTSILTDVSPTIAPKHVKRALDYIHARPERHIEPQVLADLSGVSRRTLQYSFLSTTGSTISEYQRLLRLRRAYEMVIMSPEVPLKVIAGLWGFGSQAAFGQSFRKAFGVSPSEARRDRDTSGTEPKQN